MTDITSAHARALELFNSNNPRALHLYLERWKKGEEFHSTDFVLSVIAAYGRLIDNQSVHDVPIGKLTLHPSDCRVSWCGKDALMTLTEFRITKVLAEKAGTFLSYRQIYDQVHYSGFAAGAGVQGYRTNVRSLIKRMRRKFEAVDPDFNEIETYPGFGYRWAPQTIITVPVVEVPIITTPGGAVLTSDIVAID